MLRIWLVLDHLDGHLNLAAQEGAHERHPCASPHWTLGRLLHFHHSRLPLGDIPEITQVGKDFLDRATDDDTCSYFDHGDSSSRFLDDGLLAHWRRATNDELALWLVPDASVAHDSSFHHEQEPHLPHTFLGFRWCGIIEEEFAFGQEGQSTRGRRMQEQTSFGALLKRYRLAAGLSQEALAGALSLSAQQRTMLRAAARPEMAPAPSASQPSSDIHSLPLAPTPLIGREQERSRALAILRSTSVYLLTITGPSGVGKTRLTLQLAQDLSADSTDGVAFVALAPVR